VSFVSPFLQRLACLVGKAKRNKAFSNGPVEYNSVTLSNVKFVSTSSLYILLGRDWVGPHLFVVAQLLDTRTTDPDLETSTFRAATLESWRRK
jgi:hypothetical protein